MSLQARLGSVPALLLQLVQPQLQLVECGRRRRRLAHDVLGVVAVAAVEVVRLQRALGERAVVFDGRHRRQRRPAPRVSIAECRAPAGERQPTLNRGEATVGGRQKAGRERFTI